MRRLWLGLGCALLAGCADFFKPADDSEPLHVLNALDSSAIASMKISMGVWNGNVRDWIHVYSGDRVQELFISSGGGAELAFPDSGFEYVRVIEVKMLSDSLIVHGLVRLSNLIGLNCYSERNGGFKSWPRGIYMNHRLTHLYLKGGRLASFDDSLMYLKSLKILDVSDNDIDSLPLFMYENSSFGAVDISSNRLCHTTADQSAWLDKHASGWKLQNCQ